MKNAQERLKILHAAHRMNPKTHLVHGFRSRENPEPLYAVWVMIKQRCCNPKSWAYKYYGGRGITICPDWQSDPSAFISYVKTVLGPRPSATHSIDRKNNNGNYEPGNLRWATKREQTDNRREFTQPKAANGRWIKKDEENSYGNGTATRNAAAVSGR